MTGLKMAMLEPCVGPNGDAVWAAPFFFKQDIASPAQRHQWGDVYRRLR